MFAHVFESCILITISNERQLSKVRNRYQWRLQLLVAFCENRGIFWQAVGCQIFCLFPLLFLALTFLFVLHLLQSIPVNPNSQWQPCSVYITYIWFKVNAWYIFLTLKVTLFSECMVLGFLMYIWKFFTCRYEII